MTQKYHWDLNGNHKVRYFYPDELEKTLNRVRKFIRDNEVEVDSISVSKGGFTDEDGVPLWESSVVYTGWVKEF